MNKKSRPFLLSTVIAPSLFGCAINNSNLGYGGQPTGIIVADYKTPGNLANPQVTPTKKGRACTKGVLWVAAWGDAGTNTAMQAGNITKVSNVEYDNYRILNGLYSEYCTIVYGE